MGVLKTKKKLPRRVKKTIRRTVSALCMVSAIIVALVPAKPIEGYTDIPATEKAAFNYAYGIKDDGNDDVQMSNAVDLGKYRPNNSLNDSDIYKTYYVRTDPQGNYEYWWKFKVYAQNVGGSSYGVICDYNTLYQTDLLEINKYQPIEYLTVSKTVYDSFYQAFIDGKTADSAPSGNVPNVTINGKSYKNYYTINEIGNMILDGTDEYFLSKYFPGEYANYKVAYEAWQAKMAAYQLYVAWNNGPKTDPAPNNQQTDPTDERPVLKKYVTDMSDDNKNLLKRKYFCEINQDYNTASTSIKNYTLVAAKDYTVESSGLEKPDIYLVQGEPNVDYEGGTGSQNSSDNDALGFFVRRSIPVIAIGKQAFKNVQNVNRMKLSGDIAYIGDEAFISSYVQEIEFSNVQEIGNRAFKACSRLASITFGSGTSLIGTEAFEDCSALSSVKFPYSIKRIGPGAFANCSALSTVDMSEIGQADCQIDGFAFYDDIALNSVLFSDKITKVGDAAFACSKGPTGAWREITLPDNLASFGDYMFAGRSNMSTLIMPKNYGRNSLPAVTIPEHLLWKCTQLGKLEFPDDGMGSAGYVDFADKTDIFSTITNEDFYVQGPEKNSNGITASPRKSTWGKKASGGKQVPYVYKDSAGNLQYEISDGQYILVIDKNGVLQSCQFDPSATIQDIEMVIPKTIGNTKVTGIASSCFDNETLRQHMTKLVIEDDTVSEIADGAFKNYTKLRSVSIGNTVKKIGASAFEGCNQLVDITFATPVDGYASFPVENIGSKAFSTESGKLTFHGDIDESYGPFVWATDAKNYVDPTLGIRVCYQTGYPTYLTVIVDNRNGLATLVD
nr:leucine-rich repeat domain-containing protein [Bacillota bacterium]